jgi:hypothetical protein
MLTQGGTRAFDILTQPLARLGILADHAGVPPVRELRRLTLGFLGQNQGPIEEEPKKAVGAFSHLTNV